MLKELVLIFIYTVIFLSKRISAFLDPRYGTDETLIKERNIQLDLVELLASYQVKFSSENAIKIGMLSHNIDYISIIYGLNIDSELSQPLEHALATLCRFSDKEKHQYAQEFFSKWYLEFSKCQLLLKEMQNPNQFPFWPSLQRILCSFILHYLDNRITPERINSIFKEMLPEIKPNDFAEELCEETLKTLGLLRYTFRVIKLIGVFNFNMDFKFNTFLFEKDIVSLQLIIPQIQPQQLLKVLTKNFFSFCEPIWEFFENPDILQIDDNAYK